LEKEEIRIDKFLNLSDNKRRFILDRNPLRVDQLPMNRLLPCLFAIMILSAEAGDWVNESEALFSGSLAMGYDTAYVYRGANYGDDAPWMGLDLNLGSCDGPLLNFGIWYINPTGNSVVVGDEFDLYAYLVIPFGEAWEVAVGGTWFFMPEDESDSAELGLTVTRTVFDVYQLAFEYVYDLDAEGSYFGYAVSRLFELGNKLDLTLEAGISHADESYETFTWAGDRVYTQAGLTYHLRESTDLNAYVLGNFPQGDLEEMGEGDGIYGGVSLTVFF
jgi:hypothetical protein